MNSLMKASGVSAASMPAQPAPQDMASMAQQVAANPSGMMNYMGWNVPPAVMQGGGMAVLQHLMSTGQVTQQQIQGVMSRLRGGRR